MSVICFFLNQIVERRQLRGFESSVTRVSTQLPGVMTSAGPSPCSSWWGRHRRSPHVYHSCASTRHSNVRAQKRWSSNVMTTRVGPSHVIGIVCVRNLRPMICTLPVVHSDGTRARTRTQKMLTLWSLNIWNIGEIYLFFCKASERICFAVTNKNKASCISPGHNDRQVPLAGGEETQILWPDYRETERERAESFNC